MKLGLLGHPIQHSFSPQIFNFLKNYLDIKLDYELFEIKPENFIKNPSVLNIYDGLNITTPYKEKISEFCWKITEEAKSINACNVLKKTENGFEAYNTDVFGFEESLKAKQIGAPFESALILGRGGAARACEFALKKMGCEKIQFKTRNVALNTYESGFKPQIVINATTLGTQEAEKDYEFFNIDFSQTQLAYDLIYRFRQTPFLNIAAIRGAKKFKNGLDMLILQALKSFDIWFYELDEKAKIAKKIKEIF